MTLMGIVYLAALLGGAPEGPWVSAGTHDGVRVETRERAGTGLTEVRALATLDAPPEKVWRVITDIGSYPRTVPNVLATKKIRDEGNGTEHWYFALDVPVVNDRDYAVRMERIQNGETRRFRWTASPLAPPPVEGRVRITETEGYWNLEPAEGGRTKVTYFVFANPAGRLPKFLVNKANRDTIPDLLQAVEREARGLKD